MASNQNEQVLTHLKNHKNGITSKTAFERYGITRLSGRIFELRKMGYNIETDHVTEKNRFGHPVTYARYRLVG
jgi:hypothetical protein